MKHAFCTSIRVAMISLLVTSFAMAASGYHVIKTYKLGGDGGWDYLTFDGSSRRLFISRATHVMVIDADSGKSVGDISDTPGVHGIAARARRRLDLRHVAERGVGTRAIRAGGVDVSSAKPIRRRRVREVQVERELL